MLAEKLLATATHPNTPDAEAVSAARKLGNLIQRTGGSVAGAFGLVPQRPSSVVAPLSFNQKRQLHEELQGKLDVSEHRVESLERELTKARGKIEEMAARIEELKSAISNVSKNTTFIDFSNRAKIILGISSGWVLEFCRQTGVSENIITNARVSGNVSKGLLDMLPRLKKVKEYSDSGHRLAFSVKEVQVIRKLAEKFDDENIARHATQELGRAITEGNIRKLRSNLKNSTAGYTDPAYGGALPTVLGGIHRRGQLNWSLFPDLELHICREFISGESSAALARYASEQTGFDISANQITQRVYNSPPPKKLIRAPNTEGPLTWPEVWLIGHERVKRAKKGKGWLSPTLAALGIDPAQGALGSVAGDSAAARKSIIGKSLAHLHPSLVAGFRASYAAKGAGGAPTHAEPPKTEPKPLLGWKSLTRAEKATLDLLIVGKSRQAISRLRDIGTRTVEWHIQCIMTKVGVENERALISKAKSEWRTRGPGRPRKDAATA